MTRKTIERKLYFVNENVQNFRNKKDWANYKAAIEEYARLLEVLKTLEK